MSLKILGGEARGFSLDVPQESITRPTSVLLRRRLFDAYQNLSGFYFIDLCSGSGSIALEASSRGANPVTCVESSEKAFKILKNNITKFQIKYPCIQNGIDREIDCQKIDILKWLDKFHLFYSELTHEEQGVIILYFDPPYEKIDLYEKFFSAISELNFRGVLIAEACRQKTMPQEQFEKKFGPPTRNYKQGTSFLFLYDYNMIKK